MSFKKEDQQEECLAFLLAISMAESDDPGAFRKRVTQYMSKAYGDDKTKMTLPEQFRSEAIHNIYAKADSIYHRIK